MDEFLYQFKVQTLQKIIKIQSRKIYSDLFYNNEIKQE